jgi:hypothetical protein
MKPNSIKLAQSTATDALQAVTEFHAAVAQPDMALVLFFCSSKYDLEVLTTEMNRQFKGVQVVGCTTAGEIGPAGYLEHSLTGTSFAAGAFTAVSGVLNGLKSFQLNSGQGFVQDLLQQLESKAPQAASDNSFAFMLIDGMSVKEEVVAYALQSALGNIMLFGGSAGDDQKFSKSYVFSEGRFHDDSAVLVMLSTSLPFTMFKTQHFITTEERLVVTEADTSKRIVKEINGFPAAAEYARIIGVKPDELNPMCFAASPIVVLIDGAEYVRSIQQANADGSLTFFCAIEEGVVFRVAHGDALVGNLQQTFDEIRDQIGAPQLVISCDCILRNLEATQKGIKGHVGEILKNNNSIGFSSYGEQFHGIHVNQTFTGLAIGKEPKQEPQHG